MSRLLAEPLVVSLCAVTLVFLITPLVRRLSLWVGAVSYPRDDRWHRHPVPSLGGIAIFLATSASAVALAGTPPAIVGIIVAGSAMFLLGVFDDLSKLKPSTKLTVQIAIACAVVLLVERPTWTGWWTFDALLAIIWIVMITNAFNLLDNMDGLCAGVAAIAALACWLVLSDHALAVYAAALTGASLAFLSFNFKPASIFMGDAGSLFLGGSLAVLTLTGGWGVGAGMVAAIAVPVFILLIPIFDTSFVTVSRILSTRPPSVGGRDHTSHRLVAMGFSERQAVLIIFGLAALGAATALLGRYSRVSEALLVGPLLLIGLALLGIQLARVRVYDGDDFSMLLEKSYTPLLVHVTYKRRIFEIFLDLLLVTFSYHAAYVIRFDADVTYYRELLAQSLPIVIGCQLSSLLIAGVYRGTWRYISLGDITTYAAGIGLGVLSTVGALVYLYRFEGYSRGVFVIYGMLAALLIVGSRLSFRSLAEAAGRHRRSDQRVLIYGAGDAGALVLRELRNNRTYLFEPVAFLDDDPTKWTKRILRLPVLGGIERLPSAIGKERPNAVIVSTTKITPERLGRIQQICYESGTRLLQLRFSLDDLAAAATTSAD